MPRLLSRALFVLGGATAATAAAWLLSSGTASADTMPQVPPVAAHIMSTSDSAAAAPFETPLSTAVSSVADPVTDTGSAAVTAVSEPSQHAVLPLPAVPSAAPADLNQLTTGLRDTVGQLGDRLPVSKDLPTQLIEHLGHAPVSTPADPTVPPIERITPRHLPMQAAPFAGHSQVGGVVGQVDGSRQGDRGVPQAPHNPDNSSFPLTVPAMPGNSGSGNSGSAGPAGVGLPTGAVAALFPELRVVDVLAPATEPASVLPGKQPGVTPD